MCHGTLDVLKVYNVVKSSKSFFLFLNDGQLIVDVKLAQDFKKKLNCATMAMFLS